MLAEINKRVLSQCVCKEGIVRDVPASDNAGASCLAEVGPLVEDRRVGRRGHWK